MAISRRFVATKSPRFRTCSNFEAIYWRFFQFESHKNLLWCSPECSLSQTWRTLLITRPRKGRQKKEKAQVVIRTVNVVILRCCFAEDGTDLFISACCTCSTLIFRPSTNQILICGVIAAICLRGC